MPRDLKDIEKVDLKHSKWHKDEKGEMVFDDKVLLNYYDASTCPEWYYTWARYDKVNNFRDFYSWKHGLGFRPVDPETEDTIYPLGCPIEDGLYVFEDAVFVKCPLIDELKRRAENIEKGKTQLSAKMQKFLHKTKGDGIIEEDEGALSDMIKSMGLR
jgi:hypothetical protein